jgi:hypothetical protein
LDDNQCCGSGSVDLDPALFLNGFQDGKLAIK